MTDKTEQKILDSALKLFAEKGYDASTTITLAEESGYSEMTLFRIFKTKKNLFDSSHDSRYKKNARRCSQKLIY